MSSPVLYVDCRCLQDPQFRDRGVGYHAASLLRSRLTHAAAAQYRSVGLVDPELGPLPEQYGQLLDRFTFSLNPTFTSDGAVFADLSPMTHEPRFAARFTGHIRLLKASVVYDFIPADWPGYLNTTGEKAAYLAKLARLKTASLFFPISHYSAKRLQELLGADPARIEVTGAAIRESFCEARLDFTGSANQSTTDQPYFFSVGGADIRKNSETAVRAVAAFNSAFPTRHRLVIVSNYTAETRQRLMEAGGANAGEWLDLRSDLTDAELVALYSMAVATICPSHIEGFSLPVMEAGLCGCPVLASSCAAHAELIRNRSALFSSTSVRELVPLLRRVATDSEWRASLIADLAAPSSTFCAKPVGTRFWDRIEAGIQSTLSVASVISSPKPNVAFLSPYPPDPSGVAAFTYATLASLSSLAEVDLFTNAARPLQLPEGVRDAGRITPVPYQSSRYDSIVAVLGNSWYHHPILNLFDSYGGPAVLHDSRLTQAFYGLLGRNSFTAMVSRFLGRVPDASEIRRLLEDDDPSTWCVEGVLERAMPLVVHTERYRQLLDTRFGFKASTAVFPPNHSFSPDELAEDARAEVRRKLQIGSDVVAIGHFGYAERTKRLEPVIRAIGKVRQQGVNAHLYLVGSTAHWNGGLGWIEETGSAAFVHTLGDYVEDYLYRSFLIAVDTAVQLRTYDFGQPSAGLADCISAGIPAVANASLADSCDAPEYVQRISDDAGEDEIADAILKSSERALRALNEDHRQRYIQVHNFPEYSRRLLAILGLS